MLCWICEVPVYGVRSDHSVAGICNYIRKNEAALFLFIQISIKRTARTCLHMNILLLLEQLITCSGACEMYQFVDTYSPPFNIKTNDL